MNSGYGVTSKYLALSPFVDRVEIELKLVPFGSGIKVDEAHLFNAAFLSSLNRAEREMLMPCACMLIQGGGIDVPIFELFDDEEAASDLTA